MKFDTGMGILELPHDNCVVCIFKNQYMACTRCEFKETMIEHAIPIVNMMNEKLNEYIKEVVERHKEALDMLAEDD